MPVRIFCRCGTEVTNEISAWDRKTRSLFWMDQNPPSCAACLKRRAAPVGGTRVPSAGMTGKGAKAVMR